jgi:hypothetical protein
MPEERFVQTYVIPSEIVAQQAQSIQDAIAEVRRNPNKTVSLNLEVLVRFLDGSGEIAVEFGEQYKSRDNKRRVALIRNGQLQLPGAQDLSEFAPDPEVTEDRLKLRHA